MPRDWRNAADYADLHTLDLSGLAWEFLRRSPQYVQAFQGETLGRRDAAGRDPTWRFGLRFGVDPALMAKEAPIFWRAEVAPAHVVALQSAPGPSLGAADVAPLAIAARQADDGVHFRLKGGLQLVLPAGLSPHTPLGALLDLDPALPARIAALRDLARLVRGARVAANGLTTQGRLRIVLILRALDARAVAGSYRDIARELLGAGTDSSVEWRISNTRDVAIRLCRSGRRLMGGGYRRLLNRR